MFTKRHVGHQRKPKHQTEAEPDEVRVVVNHRQQAGYKQEDGDTRQPADGPAQARRIIRIPVGEYLDKEARENSKLRSRRTSL